jgi:hypothetical protein
MQHLLTVWLLVNMVVLATHPRGFLPMLPRQPSINKKGAVPSAARAAAPRTTVEGRRK